MFKKINMKHFIKAGVIGLAAFAVPMSSAYAAGLEEIMVTARKVEESLQEVPISVTAITGEGLKDAGLFEFPAIAAVTPNFDVRSDAVRGEFAAVLNIRGQNSTTSDLSIDQAVGININGAPVTRGTNLFGNLFDIEQVEILRGPQGTLFGKNTTGGTVIVRTTAPELCETSGYGEITVGNFSKVNIEGVVNLPLGETAALRVGAASTNRDGFGDGVRSDGSLSGVDMANDDETFFRASLLIEPSDSLSIRINADTHEVDENGAIVRALRTVFPIALAITPENFYQGSNFNDGVVLPHAERPSVTAEETNINATIDADLGFADLTSVTSFRDQDSNTDLNWTPLGVITIGQESELITQELRLSGANDKLTWQTGVFLSKEDGLDRNNTIGRGQVVNVVNDSLSVFAQGTFGISDKLSLTAGARFTSEERAVELKQLAAAGGSIAAAVAALGSTSLPNGTVVLNDAAGTTIGNDAEFDAVSWTVALDHKTTENVLTYASISRGFRSGGIDGDANLAVQVDPEFVLNYELGFKGDFLDDTLRFNTSVWYSDYTDIQISSLSLTETVAGAASVPIVVLNNAAEAELYGFESELKWFVTDDFSTDLTIGYTKGKYSEFTEPRLADPADPTSVFEFDRSDEPVGGPELQFSATARYGFDVGQNTRAQAQLTLSYIDKKLLAADSVAALVDPGQAVVDAITLLNGQVSFDIGDSLSVAFWGNNLADEEYFANGFALGVFGGLAQRNIGAPRQYGIRVRKDF